MYKKLIFVPLLFLIFSCAGKDGAAGPAGADGGYVMIFQQGVSPYSAYDGCYDARLTSGAGSSENLGEAQNLLVGSNTVANFRFIIRFDLSGIVPNTVNIDKAYLTFTTGSTRQGEFNVIAYPVTNEWTEGTATAPSDPDDGVTWVNRTVSLLWSVQGGDYNLSKSSNSVSVPSGINENVTLLLPPDVVKAWITSSSTNYGVLIIGSKENLVEDNYTSFYTSEYTGNLTYRPKLILYIKP